MPDDTTETYDLQATVIDNVVRLTGNPRDFDGTTLSVTRGVPVLVRCTDEADHFTYVVEVPANGERGDCWGRNTARGLARRLFDDVAAETNHVLFAINKTTGAPVYGPIIKIKPKG